MQEMYAFSAVPPIHMSYSKKAYTFQKETIYDL